MTLLRLTILINLLGLAALQIGLIIDQRLILSWVPIGFIWPISTAIIVVLVVAGRQDRQDQL